MDINCTKQELFILKKIALAAGELQLDCYVIGGFVRDKILGRPTKDIDIVCIGDGIILAEKVAEKWNPKPPVNIFRTFGTAQVKIVFAGMESLNKMALDKELSSLIARDKERNTEKVDWAAAFEIEFVGARKESYSQESRKPAVETGTLEDDQKRRDFTINALAISLNKSNYGQLLDPFEGMQHLQEKILKTPLEPGKTFSDDPLRMMRAIRFAAQLNFTIAAATLQSITENAQRIKIISKERIAEELNKILLCKKPSIGFQLLYTTGLLQLIFPQMVALAGAEYIDGKGHKDNFYHTLQVVDNIAENTDDLWLRWAAVLHDIAKPVTKRFEEGHGFTFHGHETVGGRMVPAIFAQLKLPQNEKMLFVRKMVELHLRPISLTNENITDSAIRRLLFDAGEDLESLMILCKADITSKNKQKVQRFLQNFEMVQQQCIALEARDHIRNWQPPITGEVIMQAFSLSPSKPVGILKAAIRNAILDGEIANNYDAAFAYMHIKAREMGII